MLRGPRPLHSNSFSWCIMAEGNGRDVSLYDGEIWKLTLSTFLCLCIWSIGKEDSLSSLIVLRREVFSVFMPLKPRSAAQVDTGYLAKRQERHIPLYRTGGLCDLGRPELCFIFSVFSFFISFFFS